jgi:hypothetical protein
MVNIESVQKDIDDLTQKKVENLQYTNRSSYIREKVFEYKTLWWDRIAEMMGSDDNDLVKFALSEVNKLQSKILPTEITGADGKDLPTALVINLNKDAANANNTTDIETTTGVVEVGGQDN